MSKPIPITGASTGFGRDTAETLARSAISLPQCAIRKGKTD
jgi:NADP-dependent 3-hydroxy acid dehydrogenase YdfG